MFTFHSSRGSLLLWRQSGEAPPAASTAKPTRHWKVAAQGTSAFTNTNISTPPIPVQENYTVAGGIGFYAGMAAPPAWLASAATYQVVAVPNSIHMGSPADPTDTGNEFSRSNKRLSYSNIATDLKSKIILAAVGGHSDYSGNETTSIDLNADTPSWQLLNAASATPTADAAYYGDGKPTSRHGYWSALYSTTRSRLMLHYTRAAYGSALSFAASNGFDLTSNTWDGAGTWANAPGPALCRDSNDNVWATAGSSLQLWKWTAATDTWAQTATFSNLIGPTAAYDLRRNQIYGLCWGDGQASSSGVSSYVYNAAGTTQTGINLTSVGSALTQFQADAGNYASMVYDPIVDAFFWWDGNSGNLYKIKPNDTTVWTIELVTLTGATPPIRSYTFGRMAYIPLLKGLVLMPSGYQSLYFIKTA